MRSLLPTTPEGASRGAELVASDGRALALVSAALRGEAAGGIARLVLEQRFANPYDEALHVTYRMPLPADGAVSGYAFEIGARTITGVVDKKAAAREKFERAVARGYTAALLDQETGDIFTQQLGNLPPREALVARISIDVRLQWLPEGEWELRFPTVIGPRYIGAADTPADVAATHVKVSDRPLDVRMALELAVGDAIVAGALPTSPTHQLERRGASSVGLAAGMRLDRDLVVRWRVATPAVGLSLATARPASGDDAFGLLSIVPPAREARPVAVPRDLIVLLDTSGSMSGEPLAMAQQVVALLLDSLDERDRFELVEFASAPSRYAAEPLAATAAAKHDAIRWVRSRQAGGATEMRAAVIEALAALRVGAQRQVVVVTDGYVGGERQILEVLLQRMPASCRLHVLGVGAAVNRSLATALSRAGRGCEVLVGPGEDPERAAKRLLDRTRLPIVTNLEIAGSALLRHAPEHLPDVFEGAPLVAALALRPEGGELVVRGKLARDTWEQRLVVAPVAARSGNAAIVALYGRERVADVEARALFGTVDGEIEDLGLRFQIATRRTSWVAVDEERRVTGPTRSEIVPQELPYGTSAASFGLRAPAAPRALGAPRPTEAAPMPMMDVGDANFEPPSFDDITESPQLEAPPARDISALIAPASPGRAARDTLPDPLGGSDDEFGAEEATGEREAPPRARSQTLLGSGPQAPAQPPAPPQARSAPPPPSSEPPPPPSPSGFSPSAPPPLSPSAPPPLSPSAPSAHRRRTLLITAGILLALLALLLWWLLP